MDERFARMTTIADAIQDLCTATAQHAIAAHEMRHSELTVDTAEVSKAWSNLHAALSEHL